MVMPLTLSNGLEVGIAHNIGLHDLPHLLQHDPLDSIKLEQTVLDAFGFGCVKSRAPIIDNTLLETSMIGYFVYI